MSAPRKPHSKNVPGDFYVEDGCCLSCDVPFIEAPELFGKDGEPYHCYVKRQPETSTEMGRMIEALHRAEVACIRYRGKDAAVFKRLTDLWCQEQCDHPLG